MKQQYGITPTDEQIEKAEEIIRYYQQAPEEEINLIHSRKTLKWPYALNGEQKYDRLMHKAELSVPQRLLWMQIKPCLSDHPKERTNRNAILKALSDLEGFLQVNTYTGMFEKNRRLLAGEAITELMRMFDIAYGENRQ